MTDRPLKVLMALQYYVPHRTGLTLHVQRVAEALAERDHEVTVLTARYEQGLPRDELVINGVRVIRLWAPLRISRGMVMPAYPEAAWKLVRMHDVVSLHTPMLETQLFALYTRLLKKGLVITHHGDLILPDGWLNQFIRWFTFQNFRLAGRAAQHLIAYSEDYADHSYYIAPFRNKTTAIHPPIKTPAPSPPRAEELREQWLAGTNGAARLIGYGGRFVEEKRPDVLIRALPVIHEEFPGTRIVFAGQWDIQYEDFYERNLPLIERYREHLIFLGLIEDSQMVSDFYAAVDTLVLPSDTECFGLVQVEAMQCGTPVVATDIPGARVVVQKTGMGQIVPPGDPQAMGQAIRQVLRNPAEFVRPVGQINEIFGLEKTIDGYERLLRDAAVRAQKA